MISAAHAAGDAVETTSRDVRNRALGTIASVRSRFAADEVSDDVLEERVRARLGSVVRHPGSIEVSARDGCVTLRGPILAGDVNRLLRRVGAVRGVRSVGNQLEVHRAPDDVPGLQGEGRLPGPRPAFMQTVWSPTERLVAGAAGAWLTLYGVRQPGLVRSVAGLAGLGLLARAFTNLELKRLVGVGAGRRAVTVQKTLHISAPVEEVFDLWSHYENFPRFMTHVREIRRSEGGRSRWTVAGPGGMPLEWETIETAHEPNRRIAWKTVEGAPVAHAGVVRFDPTPEGGTRVDIKLSYNPPAGALGHGLASLLGQDPKRALDDDLLRMKSLLEDGRTRAHGQAVTREQLRRV